MAEIARLIERAGCAAYPIAICAVIAVAIAIERLIFVWWPRAKSDELIAALAEVLRVGDVGSAIAIAARAVGPGARLARVGLQHCLMPVPVLEGAIEAHVVLEMAPYRRRIGALRTIVAISMLFGLWGTITGLVFGFCGHACDHGGRARCLAAGISEALGSTALGLFVSMIAFAAAALLSAEVDRVAADVQATAHEIRNLLVEHRSVLRWNGQRAPIERGTYRSC